MNNKEPVTEEPSLCYTALMEEAGEANRSRFR